MKIYENNNNEKLTNEKLDVNPELKHSVKENIIQLFTSEYVKRKN